MYTLYDPLYARQKDFCIRDVIFHSLSLSPMDQLIRSLWFTHRAYLHADCGGKSHLSQLWATQSAWEIDENNDISLVFTPSSKAGLCTYFYMRCVFGMLLLMFPPSYICMYATDCVYNCTDYTESYLVRLIFSVYRMSHTHRWVLGEWVYIIWKKKAGVSVLFLCHSM